MLELATLRYLAILSKRREKEDLQGVTTFLQILGPGLNHFKLKLCNLNVLN